VHSILRWRYGILAQALPTAAGAGRGDEGGGGGEGGPEGEVEGEGGVAPLLKSGDPHLAGEFPRDSFRAIPSFFLLFILISASSRTISILQAPDAVESTPGPEPDGEVRMVEGAWT